MALVDQPKRTKLYEKGTHHFVINFVEVNFTNFIYDIFTLERDESESYKETKKSNSLVSLYFGYNIIGRGICSSFLAINSN